MFFFKKKKKLEEEEQLLTAQETELYAQDIIPLRTIEGSFIRRSDGVSLIGVFIEGVNDSLYTYDNKLAESRLNQQALAAIQSPCSILKIPKTIDANLQLVHIDNEITNLFWSSVDLTGNQTFITVPYLSAYNPAFRQQKATRRWLKSDVAVS